MIGCIGHVVYSFEGSFAGFAIQTEASNLATETHWD